MPSAGPGGVAPFVLRRLTPADWPLYRGIRLRALTVDPGAFGSNLARERGFDVDEWRARAGQMTVALSNRERPGNNARPGDDEPIGVAGWYWTDEPRRADLVAMWVEPVWRGSGVGAALVADVVAQVVADRGAVLELGVVDSNARAIARYVRDGFTETGREVGEHTGDRLVRMRYGPVPPVHVAVVEDHPLFRAAVAGVLDATPGFVLGVVAESVENFRAADQPAGSVVVLDLNLPGVHDAGAVREVAGMGHRVLVVSAQAGREPVVGAVAAGAQGYLTKDAGGEEIVRAIREIAAGGTYVGPTLAAFLLGASRDGSGGARLELSAREREVLSLLAAGERDQDIAETLTISVSTVRSHLDRIREKTGRRRRPELTRLAVEEGIVGERHG